MIFICLSIGKMYFIPLCYSHRFFMDLVRSYAFSCQKTILFNNLTLCESAVPSLGGSPNINCPRSSQILYFQTVLISLVTHDDNLVLYLTNHKSNACEVPAINLHLTIFRISKNLAIYQDQFSS